MLRLSVQAAAVSLLLVSACTTPGRNFRPLEKAFAASRSGRPAAEYQVVVDGERWCELRLWSDTAMAKDMEGGEGTVLRIGFEIENALDEALDLDLRSTRIEAVDLGDHQLEQVGGTASGPPRRSGPGNVWNIDLVFELPAGVVPRDVRAYRLHWVLRGPGNARFEQNTDFLADEPVRMYAYPYWGPWGWYGPYCGPYWYGRWRVGYHYAW